MLRSCCNTLREWVITHALVSIGPYDPTKSKTAISFAAYHDDYDYDYDYDSGESLPYRNILSHLHKE